MRCTVPPPWPSTSPTKLYRPSCRWEGRGHALSWRSAAGLRGASCVRRGRSPEICLAGPSPQHAPNAPRGSPHLAAGGAVLGASVRGAGEVDFKGQLLGLGGRGAFIHQALWCGGGGWKRDGSGSGGASGRMVPWQGPRGPASVGAAASESCQARPRRQGLPSALSSLHPTRRRPPTHSGRRWMCRRHKVELQASLPALTAAQLTYQLLLEPVGLGFCPARPSWTGCAGRHRRRPAGVSGVRWETSPFLRRGCAIASKCAHHGVELLGNTRAGSLAPPARQGPSHPARCHSAAPQAFGAPCRGPTWLLLHSWGLFDAQGAWSARWRWRGAGLGARGGADAGDGETGLTWRGASGRAPFALPGVGLR